MSAMLELQVASTVAAIVSALAIGAGTAFVVVQLRQAAKDRYFAITQRLFEIWQEASFQEDQLYLLHKFSTLTWDEFAGARGERAERALHRVGGYYDRVGNLIRNRLIEQQDILPTIGGYAIAVWDKIEPLVTEARIKENAFLFENFQAMLPNCRECYVPGSVAVEIESTGGRAKIDFIEPRELKSLVDRSAAVVLDVRRSTDGRKIKGSIRTSPNDLSGWLAAVVPSQSIVTYCA